MTTFFENNHGVRYKTETQFNRTYYAELVQCFDKFNDTLLYKSQNMGWKGQIDYWLSNGTNSDSEG